MEGWVDGWNNIWMKLMDGWNNMDEIYSDMAIDGWMDGTTYG